ncbi:glycoside hydrolase family 68 protein [Fructilactobacillus sanfranciscensis]|uniref:glycoside hydrolase family 68 protein n=2 Tax=Fructilactobacillus sanfranciscensis TaxID=1625 RepID=UPI000CD42CAA|nr:glycoside hydrolase family 68 protein [Fructilactobacillus sanfranciscensis]QFX93962.1 LPXTG cell wall anchor domain-containing protein [Fructilactobacillus sanfranciscensis]RDX59373.1 LPXTG cell wall anchor domain-containing protein [Fructilactobacillus sanfranciscensis]
MTKEHKKMYKVGKNWAVATLVSASILGGVTAHADAVKNNKYDGTANVNIDRQANVDGKIISTNDNATSGSTKQESSVANDNATSGSTKQESSVANDNATSGSTKQESSVANDNATSGSTKQESSVANDTKTAVVDESKNTSNTENDNSQLKQTNNEQPSAAAQANLKKLNHEATKAVQNAKIDAGSLTDEQINELNKINFSKSAEKGAKLTFKDLEGIGNAIVKQDPQYAVPYFNAKEIKNMPASYTVDAQTGKMAHLDVWDSWPVQDPVTGYVSNYKGYQLVIAMMGIPNTPNGDNHIYLLYNKYGDNDFSHWRNAGSIFGTNENNVYQEWSGSAIVNDNGTIQLFYTSNDTSDYKLNDQRLATATLNLDVDDNGVAIKSVDNYHILFEGDGFHYQTYDQFANGKDRKNDDYCLRDPHVVQSENGDRYLVFEANTGMEDYQSDDQIYNWANYGGDDAFNIKSFFKLLNNKNDRELASLANGAIGILKLNNDQTNPKVEEVYSPLVSTLMASDEVERVNVVKLGDKYYLFSATRVSRGSDRELNAKDITIVGDNVAMIGYVSDNLMGKYKPLNNSGVVLTASVPANWRTATYSYYAVPVEGHPDQVLITSYMSNKDFASGEGNYATLAPSFIVQINPDDTTTVLARATNQGDWVWDDSSRNDNMLGVLKEGAVNSAALPGEGGKPVDWSLINRSSGLGLKSHQPVQPKIGQPDQPDKPAGKTSFDSKNSPVIPGYTFKEVQGNPSQPSNATNNGVINTSTNTGSKVNNGAVNSPELPQTGENNSQSQTMSFIGILLAIFGSLLGFLGIKKRRND